MDFLQLPVEIRIQIYEYTLFFGTITISACPATADTASTIPGLEGPYIPVARSYYDHDLLTAGLMHHNVTHPATETSQYRNLTSNIYPQLTALPALHMTCRTVHAELMSLTPPGQLHLYLTFPYGVCALMHHRTWLLSRARTIHIASAFDMQTIYPFLPSSSTPTHSHDRSTLSPQDCTPGEHATALTSQAASHALSRLTSSVLGQHAAYAYSATHARSPTSTDRLTISSRLRHPFGALPSLDPRPAPPALRRLTLRVYFPHTLRADAARGNGGTYGAIWLNSLTPSTVVLDAVCGGKVSMSIARGRTGTGIEVVCRNNGGRGRQLTGLWPRMEGDGDCPEWCLSEWQGKDGAGRWRRKGDGEVNVH